MSFESLSLIPSGLLLISFKLKCILPFISGYNRFNSICLGYSSGLDQAGTELLLIL